MWLTTSNDTMQHIKCNLKHRAFNIVKFYAWPDINENTPIQIKIQVLDSCMFAAYLYGCECWWKIDLVASSILAEERRILKIILQVKSITPNDIIYVELNRCDVVSKMKSRQCKFYHKFKQLNQDEATARKILEMRSHLEVSNYYESLPDTIADTAKEQMRLRICESPSTYNSRY